MPPKPLLCPIRKAYEYIDRGLDSTVRIERDHDGGEMFTPCLQDRCAWWLWVDEVGGSGACAICLVAHGVQG